MTPSLIGNLWCSDRLFGCETYFKYLLRKDNILWKSFNPFKQVLCLPKHATKIFSLGTSLDPKTGFVCGSNFFKTTHPFNQTKLKFPRCLLKCIFQMTVSRHFYKRGGRKRKVNWLSLIFLTSAIMLKKDPYESFVDSRIVPLGVVCLL